MRPLRLLIIALATYGGVCVLLAFLQTKLIYFPTREYSQTPEDRGLEFDDLTLTTRDGVNVAAWYVKHAAATASVIFFHGNGGNMSGRLDALALLHRAGFNVLMLDYRGYGRSEGRPTEEGTYEDADAAWRYLADTEGERPERIVLFGRSLGGAVAIELALRHEPGVLVVDSTFTNLYDIGRMHYPLLPVGWLLTYRYDSIEKVGRIHCPKLFVHAQDDSLIPMSNGRRLYEAATDPKEFLETPGEHNTGGFEYAPEYAARVITFINRAISPDAP